jgi:hypothetical protein
VGQEPPTAPVPSPAVSVDGAAAVVLADGIAELELLTVTAAHTLVPGFIPGSRRGQTLPEELRYLDRRSARLQAPRARGNRLGSVNAIASL